MMAKNSNLIKLVSSTCILVDYKCSLEELLKMGSYDQVSRMVSDKHFARQNHEYAQKRVCFALFSSPSKVTSDEAVTMIEEEWYYPATLRELLFFGWKCPDFQRHSLMPGLGSLVVGQKEPGIVVLAGNREMRTVNYSNYKRVWPKDTRFLGSKLLYS